jgi:hypothetical protein
MILNETSTACRVWTEGANRMPMHKKSAEKKSQRESTQHVSKTPNQRKRENKAHVTHNDPSIVSLYVGPGAAHGAVDPMDAINFVSITTGKSSFMKEVAVDEASGCEITMTARW